MRGSLRIFKHGNQNIIEEYFNSLPQDKKFKYRQLYPQIRSGLFPQPTEENVNFVEDIYGYLATKGYIRGFSSYNNPWN